MSSTNNKKLKTNIISKSKISNTKKIVNGKINTKKVFPNKSSGLKVEDISMDDALSSRVKRNQKLYVKPNENKVGSNNKNNNQSQEKFSNTKQQKFNFDEKKVKIEDDMDDTFFTKKKKKEKPKTNNKINKPVSVKVENIPMKKALKKNKKKNDSMIVTMLFLAVVIVFMGVFLIYHFGTYDHSKTKTVTKIKEVEVPPENIVFLGDSITEQYDLDKYFPDRNTVNSGIGGNATHDILDDMKGRVYRYNPSHVFLLIGINDLNQKVPVDEIISNIKEIIRKIRKNLPKCKLYLESVYPVNDTDDKKINHSFLVGRDNDSVRKINKELKKYAKEKKIGYIDMYKKLVDEDGNLNLDYTKEGLHINKEGYELITWEINKALKNS